MFWLRRFRKYFVFDEPPLGGLFDCIGVRSKEHEQWIDVTIRGDIQSIIAVGMIDQSEENNWMMSHVVQARQDGGSQCLSLARCLSVSLG